MEWTKPYWVLLSLLPPCLQVRSQGPSQGDRKGSASHERAIYGLKGVCGIREGSFAYFALVIWGNSCGQVAYESWSLLKTKQNKTKSGWHRVLSLATSESLPLVFVSAEPFSRLKTWNNHFDLLYKRELGWKVLLENNRVHKCSVPANNSMVNFITNV